VSFHDEVRLPDISRAFQAAVTNQLADLIAAGGRIICITHSTGGPSPQCPLSRLIMLAPANFGSALAKLGKGTISRLASWAGGVEPGQGVLDWPVHRP
jgi:hypothetical protein